MSDTTLPVPPILSDKHHAGFRVLVCAAVCAQVPAALAQAEFTDQRNRLVAAI